MSKSHIGFFACTFFKMTLTACSDCITVKFACSQSCNSTKRRFYFILCTKRMSSKLRHNQTHVLKVKMHQTHVLKVKMHQLHVLKVETAPSACPQTSNALNACPQSWNCTKRMSPKLKVHQTHVLIVKVHQTHVLKLELHRTHVSKFVASTSSSWLGWRVTMSGASARLQQGVPKS